MCFYVFLLSIILMPLKMPGCTYMQFESFVHYTLFVLSKPLYIHILYLPVKYNNQSFFSHNFKMSNIPGTDLL